MKILNIYFKNINSLAGENRIHFDQVPLINDGIFAITGANGAGKSSILDAITLGLYGETFRFDRPGSHVITKSKLESFAQVEFSLGEDKFRSRWSAKRKNTEAKDESLSLSMQLFQLNNNVQIIENSPQKVRAKIADLTGMDFHKFSKSVILAQGDFAAFLHALDSERLDILEKMSGKNIYTNYKNQLTKKHTQVHALLKQLEQDFNAISLMDTAARQAKCEDLSDFKEQQIDIKNQQQLAQQQLSKLNKITEIKTQIENLTNEQQDVQNQLKKNKHLLVRAEKNQQTIEFQEELQVMDNKTAQILQDYKTIDFYRSEIETLQKHLKIIPTDKEISKHKNNLSALNLKLDKTKLDLATETTLLDSLRQQKAEKKSTLNDTETWLQEHKIYETLLTNAPDTTSLYSLRSKLSTLNKKQDDSSKWIKKTTKLISKNQATIQTLTKKNQKLVAQSSSDKALLNTICAEYTLQDLQKTKISQQERVDYFKVLFALANSYTKITNPGFFSKFFSTKTYNYNAQQLQQKSELLQFEMSLAQNTVKTLELAINHESLLKKMQNDRQYLINNKPCPLCGALEHPYFKLAPVVPNSKQDLEKQEKKIKELQGLTKILQQQIGLSKKRTDQNKYKENQTNSIKSQWNILLNKLNVAGLGLTIDKPSSVKILLKKEKNKLTYDTNLLTKFNKLENLIHQTQITIKFNKAKLTRLSDENSLLKTQRNNELQEQDDRQKSIANDTEQEKVLTQDSAKKITDLGEKITAKNTQKTIEERLQKQKQQYQEQATFQQSLLENIGLINTKISTNLNKLDTIKQQIQQFLAKIHRQEAVELHLILVAKQKLMTDKKQLIFKQQEDLKQFEQKVLAKIKVLGYVDFEQLKADIDLAKQQLKIQQQQQKLTQQHAHILTDLEQTQAQLQTEQSNNLTDNTVESLLKEQKVLTEKLYIAQQEVSYVQNKLNLEEQLQAKQKELAAKLAEQQDIATTCAVEIKLINENNLIFKRKVQQQLADRLLTQGNKILEKIGGRYYVRRAKSEHGLALEIEDTKQQNLMRSPKTLSGGESFVVSLALALSLSEMDNTTHTVESLFLDEGFGNLDAESLYLVMTTIENLKTYGKVVGIISHVESVCKRIKTQIKIIKKADGFSVLKVVA